MEQSRRDGRKGVRKRDRKWRIKQGRNGGGERTLQREKGSWGRNTKIEEYGLSSNWISSQAHTTVTIRTHNHTYRKPFPKMHYHAPKQLWLFCAYYYTKETNPTGQIWLCGAYRDHSCLVYWHINMEVVHVLGNICLQKWYMSQKTKSSSLSTKYFQGSTKTYEYRQILQLIP